MLSVLRAELGSAQQADGFFIPLSVWSDSSEII